MLTPYALPAIVALLAKCGMYFYAHFSRVHNQQTRLYLLFLFSLSIQNVVEIYLFSVRAKGIVSPPGGTVYFSVSVLAIAFLLHLSLVMAIDLSSSRRGRLMLALVYTPAVMLELLLWFTPLVVAGLQPMNYTYTKVPGPLYPLFELYALSYLFATAATLIYGARAQKTTFRRLQNKFLFVGLFPWVALVIVIIVLQRFGFRGFNSTITLPLAITFFLAVTAYAVHQYRLFDIEFFLPWSKVRKRKTAFYQRIQSTIAAIAELRSVQEMTQLIANTLRCQVALLGGPQPMAALVEGQSENSEDLLVSRFPRDTLQKVEQIVVAQEIADKNLPLYRMMERYKVGAIVPFRSYNAIADHWLVLGEHFSNEVYTPLDFKMVEGLFAAMAERFLDDFVEVRSQLHKAQEQMRRTTRYLGLSWHEEHEVQKELDVTENENRELFTEREQLRRETLEVAKSQPPNVFIRGETTLQEFLNGCEREAIVGALERCRGSKPEAARLLGITYPALEHLLEVHKIDESRWILR